MRRFRKYWILLPGLLFALSIGVNAAAQKSAFIFLNQQKKAADTAAGQPDEQRSAVGTAHGPESGDRAQDAEKPERRWLVALFLTARSAAEQLGQRARFLVFGIKAAPGEIAAAASGLPGQKPLEIAVPVFLILVFGSFCEYMVKLRMRDLHAKLETVPPSGGINKLGRVLLRFSLDFLSTAVYVFCTFIVFVFVYRHNTSAHFLAAVVLLFSYYVKAIAVALRLFFSPKAPGIRLIPLRDADARFACNWLIVIAATGIALGGVAGVFKKLGVGEAVHLALYNFAGATVVLSIAAMIWSARKRVTGLIRENWLNKKETVSPLGEKLAETWHVWAILYTLAIGLFWEIGMLLEDDNLVNRLIASFLCAPLYVMLDQWGQKLLNLSFQKSTIPLSEGPDQKTDMNGEIKERVSTFSTAENNLSDRSSGNGQDRADDKGKHALDIRHFARRSYIEHKLPFIRKLFRAMLAGLMFFSVLRLWGVDLAFGRAFTQAAMAILVSLVLAYLTWEFARSRIDRKLEEENFFEMENTDEEGHGGSRLGTLLFLLKKFILVLLVVISTMIILSSLGIDIGPLIAGAGIVGIAIGFGAQTLVKDIISGIFFLIDDAFRIGDYVDTGGLKGMVEQISLRSLRLRHHRGPIHTVPFGSLDSVTNMSRDYIIEKLSFRVRYDADVDAVRKIIKKINSEISGDPDLGPKLLGRIKSQGVREMDDSAMIMRVKFKCVPGEQFMIRKEVFRMMQEKFKEAGIEFAHRNVTVYFPPDPYRDSEWPPGKPDEKIANAPVAAAPSSEQEKRQAQGTDKTSA